MVTMAQPKDGQLPYSVTYTMASSVASYAPMLIVLLAPGPSLVHTLVVRSYFSRPLVNTEPEPGGVLSHVSPALTVSMSDHSQIALRLESNTNSPRSVGR